MDETEFRSLALALPEGTEGSHMGTADFRVRGKIFATLGYPERGWAVVKLTRDEQEVLVDAAPEAFAPVPGGWGLRGYTRLRLEAVDEQSVRGALQTAWRNTAPKSLLRTAPF
jgi:hypothetical protein